ncbi:MAG: stage II sporulation protein E [Clostridium sp.]
MQYGMEFDTYKRVTETGLGKRGELRKEHIKLIISILIAFLLSRVTVYISIEAIQGISPFGIAFLLVNIVRGDYKESLVISIATVLGYITISDDVAKITAYIILSTVVVCVSIISEKYYKQLKELELFGVMLITNIASGIILNNFDIGVTITLSIINVVVVIPIYYIIRNSFKYLSYIGEEHLYSQEELITIAGLICLVISGIGQIGLFDITVKNIIGTAVIILIAYIAGGSYGAAAGCAMGIIMGITSSNMILSVAYFSALGLMVGMFKDTGKILSTLSAFVIYIGVFLYSQELRFAGVVECAIGCSIFLVIPKSVIKKIEGEIDFGKKVEIINTNKFSEIKEEFGERVDKFGGALDLMSKTLVEIGNNNKLLNKNRSTALVDGVADRVCAECKKCKVCWDKEFSQTYNSFMFMIKTCEDGNFLFPTALKDKCDKKLKLKKATEESVKGLLIEEMRRSKLEEGRRLLATHIKNVANSVDKMVMDFKGDIEICGNLEMSLKKAFNKNDIKYLQVFSYIDKSGRMKIKIKFEEYIEGKYSQKKVLEVINLYVKNPMIVNEDESRVNPDGGEYVMVINEMPKFKLVSGAATEIKDGEDYSGDYYSFGKVVNGKYITVISDGMGSGPEAGKESKITVDLVEQFLESGFDEKCAVDTINTIMGMKFEEDEKFATLDLGVVDTYTGEGSFIKVGATTSFIKRGEVVKAITTNVPPFGLVDSIELEEVKVNLKEGDMIITVSDGVIDIDKRNVGDYVWLEDYLQKGSSDPKVMAGDILKTARDLGRGQIKDDMTILVSKVYSMY